MSVSEYSTVTALEELFDLLKGKEPDARQALEQVESLLQHQPCSREVRAAGEATAEIIGRLLLPVLDQDKTRLARAQTLQEGFVRNDHATEEVQVQQGAILKEMQDWVLDCSAPDPLAAASPPEQPQSGRVADPTAVALPRTLFARLTAALRLLCESEEPLREAVTGWQQQSDPPWEEVSTLLAQIQEAGHKAAVVPWMRQRRAFYDALLQVAAACEEGGPDPTQKDGEISALLMAMNKPGSRVEAHRIHGLLYARVSALHQQARSLKRRQDESRERAEQLKARLDDLEVELSRARDAQFLDPVTGIPDRFAFTAHLQRYLERAMHLKEGFSLVLFHCHNLQHLMDTLDATTEPPQEGVSGRLVTALTEEMRRYVPEEAFLARLSAERFVILLPKQAEMEGEQVGAAIVSALEDTRFRLEEREVTLKLLSGCATYQSGMDAAQMLEITNRLAASAHAQKRDHSTEAQRVRVC